MVRDRDIKPAQALNSDALQGLTSLEEHSFDDFQGELASYLQVRRF